MSQRFAESLIGREVNRLAALLVSLCVLCALSILLGQRPTSKDLQTPAEWKAAVVAKGNGSSPYEWCRLTCWWRAGIRMVMWLDGLSGMLQMWIPWFSCIRLLRMDCRPWSQDRCEHVS